MKSLVLFFIAIFYFGSALGQRIATVPPLTGGNGSQGITFNLKAKNSIILDTLFIPLYNVNSSTDLLEIWYQPIQPISSAPTISLATGWKKLGEFPVVATNASLNFNSYTTVAFNQSSIKMNAGTEYGFYVGNLSHAAVIYSDYLAPQSDTFVNNDVVLTSGPNTGFGGSFPNPINTPRQFCGEIAYHLGQGTDLAISQIIAPAPPIISGSSVSVTTEISNEGTNTITATTLAYQLDQQTAISVPWTGSIVPGGKKTFTFPLPLTMPNSGSHTLRVWGVGTNGNTDVFPGNDTLSIPICFYLNSGTYHVGQKPGNDFPSLQSALNALMCGGGNGTIQLMLDSGIYTGPFYLTGPITGNPNIIITGLGNQKVILNEPANNNSHLFRVESMSHLKIEQLFFQKLAKGVYNKPIAALSILQSDQIEISQCGFAASSNFGDDPLVLVDHSDFVLQHNNHYFSGNVGVEWKNGGNNNQLSQSFFGKFSNNICKIDQQKGLKVDHNLSENSKSSLLILAKNFEALTISNNEFNGTFLGNTVFDLWNGIQRSSGTNRIFNNVINLNFKGNFAIPQMIQLHVDSSDGKDYYEFYNNTLHAIYAGTPFFGNSSVLKIVEKDSLVTGSLGGLIWKNNIGHVRNDTSIYVNGDFYAYDFADSSMLDSINMNYNNYFLGRNMCFAAIIQNLGNPNILCTMSDWVSATNQDAQSDTLSPKFVSEEVLIPLEKRLDNQGKYVGINQDILGKNRITPTTDLGAYEYILSDQEVGLKSLVSPENGCGLGVQDSVTFRWEHLGTIPISSLSFSLELNGVFQGTDTLVGNFKPGKLYQYTFKKTVDLSQEQEHLLKIYIKNPLDSIEINDTLWAKVYHLPTLTAPDTQTFDQKNAWISYGKNNSWEYGIPVGATIQSAYSPPVVWTTNLSGDYNMDENSYVQSPCYDITQIRIPMVRFQLEFDCEQNFDGTTLEASSDGGVHWTVVGSQNSGGEHWYNGALSASNYSGDVWTGLQNNYLEAKHSLSQFQGAQNLIFRFHMISDIGIESDGFAFDNFIVYDSLGVKVPTNVTLVSIDTPWSGCHLGSFEKLSITLSNTGLDTIQNIPLRCSIAGPTGIQTLTDTVWGSIPPLSMAQFTFSNRINFSSSGNYFVSVSATLAGDSIASDDSLFTTIINPQISAFPYQQNFESGVVGNILDPGQLPAGWNWIPDSTLSLINYAWYLNRGATPSNGTGPNFDHTTGNGKYVYTEASNGNAGDTAVLYSPCINLGGLIAPKISYWYHMAGLGIGKLYLEMERNGIWTTIDSIIGQVQTLETDPWLKKKINLAPTGVTKFRFKAIRGNGFDGDIGLDDIEIFDGLSYDLELNEITRPISGCGLTASDSISVRITNAGTQAQNGLTIGYRINQLPMVSETTNQVILPGQTMIYTFATTGNFSALGSYQLKVFSQSTSDSDRSNDSLYSDIVNARNIISLPDTERFDINNGGWSVSGKNSSWAHGVPSGTVVNTAYSAPKVWKTNPSGTYNNGENSTLISPCYDLSTANIPKLNFKLYYDTEQDYDFGYLEYTIDNGKTWIVLDDANTSIYNGYSLQNNYTGPCWTGTSTGWQNINVGLNSFAGYAKIRFRLHFMSDASYSGDGLALDNFVVYDSLPFKPSGFVNLSVSSFISPTNNSFCDSSLVSIVIRNVGTSTYVGNLDVGYSRNNMSVQTQSIILGNALNPGDTLIHQFSQKFYSNGPGAQTICGYVSSKDTLPNNDTLCIRVYSQLGTKDVDIASWNMYPNPNHGVVTIQGQFIQEQQYCIKITDLTGRLIQQHWKRKTELENGIVLDIHDSAPGLYLIKIEGKLGTWGYKMTKE